MFSQAGLPAIDYPSNDAKNDCKTKNEKKAKIFSSPGSPGSPAGQLVL
jgi:hypothetical protein